MTKIIVGVEDPARSRDAVAFAVQLAKVSGARLVLATVYPSEAAVSIEELEGVAADVCVLAGGPPAEQLHALAVRGEASLIVLGSSHRGAVGRTFPGTTAERLVHGAPCPVAAVPDGFAEHSRGTVTSIMVGYDGGREARVALAAAMAAARPLAAAVRAVRVLEPFAADAMQSMGATASVAPAAELEFELRQEFEAEIAALPGGGAVETEFVIGYPVEELAARSVAADLVIVGSRRHGLLRAVLLGSVSGRLVREADCPVVVVPRGVDAHFDELFKAPPAGVGA